MPAVKTRQVGDVFTTKVDGEDVEATVISVHRGLILARVNDSKQHHGYFIVHQ
jgi:hypothetical protein